MERSNDLLKDIARHAHEKIFATGQPIVYSKGNYLTFGYANGSEIQVKHIFEEKMAKILVGLTLAQIEKYAILQTLEACNGNKSEAARMLDISEKTIYNKLKSYKV